MVTKSLGRSFRLCVATSSTPPDPLQRMSRPLRLELGLQEGRCSLVTKIFALDRYLLLVTGRSGTCFIEGLYKCPRTEAF